MTTETNLNPATTDQEREQRANHEQVIHGCQAIFAALLAIDDGVLKERNTEAQIINMRGGLMLAGEQLCDMAGERF